MYQSKLCKNYLLKWAEKNFKRIKKWQENTCGRAAFLEILQAAITYQMFPWIMKLILQKNFSRNINKYALLCDAIEMKR